MLILYFAGSQCRTFKCLDVRARLGSMQTALHRVFWIDCSLPSSLGLAVKLDNSALQLSNLLLANALISNISAFLFR